jgi:hypothetical protein
MPLIIPIWCELRDRSDSNSICCRTLKCCVVWVFGKMLTPEKWCHCWESKWMSFCDHTIPHRFAMVAERNKAYMFGMRLFCVCVVLCLDRGLATSWSLVQGVLLSVKWSSNWKSEARAQGAVEPAKKNRHGSLSLITRSKILLEKTKVAQIIRNKEPKGWLREMPRGIRSAVLQTQRIQSLSATYTV